MKEKGVYMKEAWEKIYVPRESRWLIWIYLKGEPIVVIQAEPGENIQINFKPEAVTVEMERL